MSVTVHLSPLRTQDRPARRRRSLRRVMTVSPMAVWVPSCSVISRVPCTVPLRIRSFRARRFRVMTDSRESLTSKVALPARRSVRHAL